MQVITLHHPHHLNKQELPSLVMALGFFDGVHLGHRKVIGEAQAYAKSYGLKSAVMTFDPHPSVVLGKETKHVHYITPINDKIKLIEEMGIHYLFIIHFSQQFANLLPQQFIDQYIIGLNVKHVVSGFDYTYGRMGKGTTETMPFHSRDKFTQSIVPKLTRGDAKISSTLIRSYIREGKLAELPKLLGRYYTVTGTVVNGDKRGRKLGFPTANIRLNNDYIIPPIGVYAVRIFVDGSRYEGVCNVGYTPTFKDQSADKQPTIEVHILNFNKEIYLKTVKIEWHTYIRKEQKFSDVQQLIKQIDRDKQTAIDYFEKNSC
ncbi:bifunctional riboflavin kinase/FAD synthetase [Bacillus aquiflavi]|uniref:Riboflavin biosynthesis protein n=1 Tax=Bacillus aquiflavi TaxID=2672567 RepID=A0A6B3VXZ4_9BACI|nr:bifunctional riboflavin kinase/FAD synthetase [Bacillus aquiflavi]MBA4536235.1 bifunctional riboflavin kinase/FAD synthetase [Bacillus aquiflavi]NEY80603.1 bifunctional riboflavin kinase/FAD synthetase [Bacillus aquiflavi]UAC49419.1 bifunctional riboflavin kinase/FAD synthetase [Bacillus aquiflavi]